jgi:hypothetical protein
VENPGRGMDDAKSQGLSRLRSFCCCPGPGGRLIQRPPILDGVTSQSAVSGNTVDCERGNGPCCLMGELLIDISADVRALEFWTCGDVPGASPSRSSPNLWIQRMKMLTREGDGETTARALFHLISGRSSAAIPRTRPVSASRLIARTTPKRLTRPKPSPNTSLVSLPVFLQAMIPIAITC